MSDARTRGSIRSIFKWWKKKHKVGTPMKGCENVAHTIEEPTGNIVDYFPVIHNPDKSFENSERNDVTNEIIRQYTNHCDVLGDDAKSPENAPPRKEGLKRSERFSDYSTLQLGSRYMKKADRASSCTDLNSGDPKSRKYFSLKRFTSPFGSLSRLGKQERASKESIVTSQEQIQRRRRKWWKKRGHKSHKLGSSLPNLYGSPLSVVRSTEALTHWKVDKDMPSKGGRVDSKGKTQALKVGMDCTCSGQYKDIVLSNQGEDIIPSMVFAGCSVSCDSYDASCYEVTETESGFSAPATDDQVTRFDSYQSQDGVGELRCALVSDNAILYSIDAASYIHHKYGESSTNSRQPNLVEVDCSSAESSVTSQMESVKDNGYCGNFDKADNPQDIVPSRDPQILPLRNNYTLSNLSDTDVSILTSLNGSTGSDVSTKSCNDIEPGHVSITNEPTSFSSDLTHVTSRASTSSTSSSDSDSVFNSPASARRVVVDAPEHDKRNLEKQISFGDLENDFNLFVAKINNRSKRQNATNCSFQAV
uniref:uncharacterized protein LOC108949846 n=1 Tax=Ciona intestinalis TaxID=7719 RepID=UPI00089DB00C|nr:uncharacterized protein LOC108949846 [Ciona intestinalis]|eukprot:XP_018669252.1 uncharacterized protein LOC108949846 [Ciona intestinalis]